MPSIADIIVPNSPSLHLAHNLPPLPRQLTNPPRNLPKPQLEPRPPPLTIQPLPLQPSTLVKPLLVEIALDLVPRHQRPQHTNTPNNIPSAACIQLYCPTIRQVEAGIVRKRFLLLGCEGGCVTGLILQRRIQQVVWQGHGVEVQARRAAGRAVARRVGEL